VQPPSDDGSTFSFAARSPLVAADQNTAPAGADPVLGTDIYEWRDGRRLLVTDGLTNWDGDFPTLQDMSPSGEDIAFIAPARYTPDALDDFPRVYTAKIGGGFEFPPEGLPPCDLNSGACEGPGTSAPDQPGAGSAAFQGPGNPRPRTRTRCSRGKRRVTRKGRARCVAKKRKRHSRAAKHNRRDAR
jgi:hypothetical protein